LTFTNGAAFENVFCEVLTHKGWEPEVLTQWLHQWQKHTLKKNKKSVIHPLSPVYDKEV
jgi:hypothetical protein